MYIQSIKSNLRNVWGKPVQVVTELGKFKGYSLAIRKEIENGLVREKQFIFWNDNLQVIFNKARNGRGRFDRLG